MKKLSASNGRLKWPKRKGNIKKGHRVLRKAQLVKYAFIKDNQSLFSITTMCRVLNIKHSRYYDWLSRDISDQQIHRNQCELLVRVAHSETKERYSHERLHTLVIIYLILFL